MKPHGVFRDACLRHRALLILVGHCPGVARSSAADRYRLVRRRKGAAPPSTITTAARDPAIILHERLALPVQRRAKELGDTLDDLFAR